MDFLIKRFARIWPIYAVVTLCYAFVRLGGWSVFDNRVVLGHIAHSLLFLPVGNGPPPGFGRPVLEVGWTLNYEMYFYFVFGISLLFGRWRWWALAAWLGLFLLLIPQLHSSFSLNPAHDYGFVWSGLQVMTSPIVWQFVAGVVIGLLYHARWTLSGVRDFSNTCCFSHSRWLPGSTWAGPRLAMVCWTGAQPWFLWCWRFAWRASVLPFQSGDRWCFWVTFRFRSTSGILWCKSC